MPFAVTYMDLETILMSKVSQIDKDKCMILLKCGIQKHGTTEQEIQKQRNYC